jgi:pSer/pThr/pTyr-binding forkhead associated (FHA) protein
VRDLGSNNGTFVNGRRVTQAELHDGDVIQVGFIDLRFREG